MAAFRTGSIRSRLGVARAPATPSDAALRRGSRRSGSGRRSLRPGATSPRVGEGHSTDKHRHPTPRLRHADQPRPDPGARHTVLPRPQPDDRRLPRQVDQLVIEVLLPADRHLPGLDGPLPRPPVKGLEIHIPVVRTVRLDPGQDLRRHQERMGCRVRGNGRRTEQTREREAAKRGAQEESSAGETVPPRKS